MGLRDNEDDEDRMPNCRSSPISQFSNSCGVSSPVDKEFAQANILAAKHSTASGRLCFFFFIKFNEMIRDYRMFASLINRRTSSILYLVTRRFIFTALSNP